mgnify:FL=1|tara:strand:- start:2411 stop:2659 length:249 start_codon:yes stop_codon:yes gene_type:complete
MKTPKHLSAEYDALAIPISRHMMKNHYEHWGNFPHELSRMTSEWISKLESLGYEVEAIKALRADIDGLSEHYKSKLERLAND